MDFNLSEDQEMLKKMIRDFSKNKIAPQVKTLEEKHEFPLELLKNLSELGVLGMSIPSEYNGSKSDFFTLILAIEEISRVFPSLAVIISVHCSLFCYAILTFGTGEQKEKYLPDAAKGKILGAFSLTEPGAGSDATNIKAKSTKKGDYYILNGTKNWVTNGADADMFIIFTKSEILMDKKKLNAFIVEKNTPGMIISNIEEKMGLHSSLTAEVTLEDCKVPSENLLGEEGEGTKVAFTCLDYSRIGIAAQALGLSQKALDEAVRYAKQREAFGKKIAEFQAVQFQLADMSTLIEASRLLTYRAANLHDKGKPFSKESAMAKLFASETANKVAYNAIQIHGGYGYSKEFPVEQLYRDARVFSIYEGTSEIQRLIIARNLLKEFV